MKKICNFPEKSELPKFILPVKINSLILFFAVSGVEIKEFAERSEQSRFLAARFRARGYAAHACAKREPARGPYSRRFVSQRVHSLASSCCGRGI